MIIVLDNEDFRIYASQCSGIKITDKELDEMYNIYKNYNYHLKSFSEFLKELIELKIAEKKRNESKDS